MKKITRYIKRICHNCGGTGTDYNSKDTNCVCRICGGSGIEEIKEIEEIFDLNNPINYTNQTDTARNSISWHPVN